MINLPTAKLKLKIKQLKAENKELKQKYWSDLNTARCMLLNRIEDLTALAENIRLKELELLKP